MTRIVKVDKNRFSLRSMTVHCNWPLGLILCMRCFDALDKADNNDIFVCLLALFLQCVSVRHSLSSDLISVILWTCWPWFLFTCMDYVSLTNHQLPGLFLNMDVNSELSPTVFLLPEEWILHGVNVSSGNDCLSMHCVTQLTPCVPP